MRLAIYAHPFDLDALRTHGGLARLRDLGFTEVAMATSYHDGRWLQPWHPAGRVRFLEDGTVHFRPRGDYGVLQPKPSSEVPAAGPSPLERLCAEAPPLGIAVRAWSVFAHNTRLGTLHPELCVQNALGDRYPYALCPSQPAVQQYAVAMTKDLAAHTGLGSIEFEALGWMGWKHSSHHDKASFAPRGQLDYALSACFCKRCDDAIGAAAGGPGAGGERARAWARAMIRRGIEDADAMAPPAVPDRVDPKDLAALDPATLEADAVMRQLLAARESTMAGFGRLVRAAMPRSVTAAVQCHPTATFTGSQLPIGQASCVGADEVVFTAYGDDVPAIEKLLASESLRLAPAAPRRRRVSIWPKAPQFRSDEDLVKLRELLVCANVDVVAIYHLGLLPWRTIERAAKMLRA